MSSRSANDAAAEIVIPAEPIVRELSRLAQPGYHGSCEIRLVLRPEALKCIELVVTPRRKVRSQDQSLTLDLFQRETERERTVREFIARLAPKLRLYLETTAIVAHFSDGQIQTCDLVDEHTVKITGL